MLFIVKRLEIDIPEQRGRQRFDILAHVGIISKNHRFRLVGTRSTVAIYCVNQVWPFSASVLRHAAGGGHREGDGDEHEERADEEEDREMLAPAVVVA